MTREEIIARLHTSRIDYDGGLMPDGAEPLNVTCGLVREAVKMLQADVAKPSATDREIAKEIGRRFIVYDHDRKAQTDDIEKALAAARTDGARQMREAAAAVIRPMGDADARDSDHYRWLAAQIEALPLTESAE